MRNGKPLRRPSVVVPAALAALLWGSDWVTPGSTHAQGWPSDPSINVAIVDTAGEQRNQRLLADAGGGLFVGWYDAPRTYAGLRLQRLTSRGEIAPGWPPLGLLVGDSTSGWQDQRLVRSGPDAVVACWVQIGTGRLRAQRVDTTGTPQWTPGGVQVSGGSVSGLEDAVGMPDGGVMLFFRRDYPPRRTRST